MPVDEWLRSLDRPARIRCLARIVALAAFGHELRRPLAARLVEGIHELRIKHHRLNLRLLYFFDGGTVVVTHGLLKQEARVPRREIDRAQRARREYLSDRSAHGFEPGE